MNIANLSFPNILYRYYSLPKDPKGYKEFIESISSNLRFTLPEHYNHKKELKDAEELNFFSKPLINAIKSEMPGELNQYVLSMHNLSFKSLHVCSLSEASPFFSESEEMWCNYGDNGAGIVAEYAVAELNKILDKNIIMQNGANYHLRPEKVNYKDRNTLINNQKEIILSALNNKQEAEAKIRELLLLKTPKWRYEAEWRLIEPRLFMDYMDYQNRISQLSPRLMSKKAREHFKKISKNNSIKNIQNCTPDSFIITSKTPKEFLAVLDKYLEGKRINLKVVEK